MIRTSRTSTLLLSLLFLSACSSEAVSSVVPAAEGGTVTLGDHSASIPPASLAADTEIVIQTGDLADYAPLEGARSDVLELLPADTVLETPATVTIGAGLVSASEGQSVAVHQFRDVDGEQFWAQLEASPISGGGVSVAVTRFGPLAVVVTDADARGSLSGTMTWGGDGTAVDGATLELWQGETMLTTTTTDAAGMYEFSDLEAGTYSVRGNPECAVDESVSVGPGANVTRDITLCG